jgi:hypothetical protein
MLRLKVGHEITSRVLEKKLNALVEVAAPARPGRCPDMQNDSLCLRRADRHAGGNALVALDAGSRDPRSWSTELPGSQ